MTPADLDALNRRIFTKLPHPDMRIIECSDPSCARYPLCSKCHYEPWWKPGQMCNGCEYLRLSFVGWPHAPHEISPPNIMDWDTFGRVLVETKPHELYWDSRWKQWVCRLSSFQSSYQADDPRIALALTVDADGAGSGMSKLTEIEARDEYQSITQCGQDRRYLLGRVRETIRIAYNVRDSQESDLGAYSRWVGEQMTELLSMLEE